MQSYSRVASLVEPSLDVALRALKLSHVDILCLAWWDDLPPERILDVARVLREKGKIRTIMLSCHHRPSLPLMEKTAGVDSIMVRYNAAHTGAEREVFPQLARDPGVLAFTATRWGSLLNPKLTPNGEKTPRGSDCYRFALTNPAVHATLAGPANGHELDEALAAIERGPMSDAELAWMRRVGKNVRDQHTGQRAIGMLDRIRAGLFGAKA